MVIVTGGAGFIGSNLVSYLNKQGVLDIVITDDLTDGKKGLNLSDLMFSDFIDKDHLFDFLMGLKSNRVNTIFHLGACSSTKEWNGKYLIQNNYAYSKKLIEWCQNNSCSFIYASSASTYGLGKSGFKEDPNCEKPINMYAISKLLLDNYVRNNLSQFSSQVVGLRYFNVYGEKELHKKDMISPIHKFSEQILNNNVCEVFGEYGGFKNGEHMRDFVHVDDCAAVNYYFMNKKHLTGIYNVGSGIPSTFKDVASYVSTWFQKNKGINSKINYIDFPDILRDHYQSYTCADLSKLYLTGFNHEFISLRDGINKTLKQTYG